MQNWCTLWKEHFEKLKAKDLASIQAWQVNVHVYISNLEVFKDVCITFCDFSLPPTDS